MSALDALARQIDQAVAERNYEGAAVTALEVARESAQLGYDVGSQNAIAMAQVYATLNIAQSNEWLVENRWAAYMGGVR